MPSPLQIAERYLAAWNEPDAERRLRLLKTHWEDDARYVDPLGTASGVDELNGLIGGAQARFPNFRFALKGTPDGHGDHVRLSWTLGPDGVEAPIEGSDVIVTAGERIAHVIGFLDKVPQAA